MFFVNGTAPQQSQGVAISQAKSAYLVRSWRWDMHSYISSSATLCWALSLLTLVALPLFKQSRLSTVRVRAAYVEDYISR